MERGEIRQVDLDPARAGEANGRRPAVVVSNAASNRVATALRRGVVTVVPVTSNVERVYAFQVLLPADECGLDRPSKAQAEQVRAVAVSRVGELVGHVPPNKLRELDAALRLHLAL